jgi:hypothetical protein
VVTKEMEKELAVAHSTMISGCSRWSLHTTRTHGVTITEVVAALGMQELQHYRASIGKSCRARAMFAVCNFIACLP